MCDIKFKKIIIKFTAYKKILITKLIENKDKSHNFIVKLLMYIKCVKTVQQCGTCV